MINDQQYAQLLKPLNSSRIAKRSGAAGMQLSYLEAWDVKAHLIRIFGFGGWSWDVISADMAYEQQNEKGNWDVGYKVIGTLTIRSLLCTYTEGSVGSAISSQRGEAHDMAVKTAESDAIKRTAINLGTQFGLSLYADGATRDVVGMTLDRDTVSQPVPEPVVDSPKETIPDTEGAAEWIEQMKAAIADKDIPALLEVKKQMNSEDVNDWVYQGITLAKWLDKAMVGANK